MTQECTIRGFPCAIACQATIRAAAIMLQLYNLQPCMTVMAVAVIAAAIPKNGVPAVLVGLAVPTVNNDPETNNHAMKALIRVEGPCRVGGTLNLVLPGTFSSRSVSMPHTLGFCRSPMYKDSLSL